MKISYKLLINKNINRADLQNPAKISSSTIAKLGKGENVTTEVLIKICEALDCKLEDIMENVEE